MLRERSQTQRNSEHTIPFTGSVQNRYIPRDTKQIRLPEDMGVSFWDYENFLELDRDDLVAHYECTKCH